MLEQKHRRSTDVDIPTSGAGALCLILNLLGECSLSVKLLGLLVERCALLDGCEALDLEFCTGLLDCCNPWRSLAANACLLADHPARLVLHEISFGVPTLGLADLTRKEMTPCELGRDWLLLHGLHGLHGGHRLHCLGGLCYSIRESSPLYFRNKLF